MPEYEWAPVIRRCDGTIHSDEYSIANTDRSHRRIININNFGSHPMDSYWIGNFRARWISADEHWEPGAFLNNFADERPHIPGFELSTLCGCDEYIIGKPRWWGVNVHYSM